MSETVSGEELEKINGYAREPLTEDKVFVFRVALCDNDIDRDGEKFSSGALRKLAELFKGRTGIFDHDPKSSKQTARSKRVKSKIREETLMKEIKYSKYSKQWFGRRDKIQTDIVHFYCRMFPILALIIILLSDGEYSSTFINIIMAICGGIICFGAVLGSFLCYNPNSDCTYEEYIYNRIKKIKRKQDRKYRKWLM